MHTRVTHEDGRVLERDGCRLHYWLHGPADGPLVILLHGLSLDRHAFDDQVPALVEGGCRVLTWDLRGHGSSQPMGPGIGVGRVADDLLAILDDVPADRGVLVGQSFGGMVAQEFVSRYPDRVVALVAIGSPALGDRPGAVMRGLQRLRVRMIEFWPDRLLRTVFAAMVTREPAVRRYVRAATDRLDKDAFVAVSAAAMAAHLRSAGAPTHGVSLLLVQGEGEERPVARAMRRWAQGVPGAEHVMLPGGHLVNQEAPDRFNEVLLEFVDHVHAIGSEPTPSRRPRSGDR